MHHDDFKSPIKIEVSVKVDVAVTFSHKSDDAELAALTKDLATGTAALSGAISPKP